MRGYLEAEGSDVVTKLGLQVSGLAEARNPTEWYAKRNSLFYPFSCSVGRFLGFMFCFVIIFLPSHSC
jgi:hypothetical protein